MMLLLIVTLGCSVKCKHCCLACEPQKSIYNLDDAEMIYFIESAHNKGINCVGFSGGEPMLYDLREPMTVAQKLEMYIDVRTNAYWAESYEIAYSILASMKDNGLKRLGLSFDNYHSQRLDINYFRNALQAARALSIDIYVDWIGLELRAEILEYLGTTPAELRYAGAPLRIGRATKLNKSCFISYPQDAFLSIDGCGKEDAPFLTIYPGEYGAFHPCCWVNPALIREINTQDNDWLSTLQDDMETSPMVSFLRDYGIGGLIRKARQEKPELLKPYYSHQCEVCYDLLGELFPQEVQDMPQYIEDFKGKSMEKKARQKARLSQRRLDNER